MAIFYHVSLKDYESEKKLELYNDYRVPKDIFGGCTIDEIHSYLQTDFDKGLSQHGIDHLIRYPVLYESETKIMIEEKWTLEIILELIRKMNYPQLPSRFTAAFGWDNLESANRYKEQHCKKGKIYEVEAESIFKGDMNLVNFSSSGMPGTILYAEKYWSGGVLSNQPLWEHLLLYPVKIIEKVS